jgi:hypothetical protein
VEINGFADAQIRFAVLKNGGISLQRSRIAAGNPLNGSRTRSHTPGPQPGGPWRAGNDITPGEAV